MLTSIAMLFWQTDRALLVVKHCCSSHHLIPRTDDLRFLHFDVQNQHQAELVAQLRQESQQWKDQCLRLDEALRGEIKAWKDQFLRVDAEHTRLLSQQLSSATSLQVRP
jgi:hypothetical protein